MIAKNENPLPVTYSCYNSQVQLTNEELLNKVNFKIFYDLVCLTSKSLALVTGTKSTFRNGKTSLIPFMFSGLNQFSTYKTRKGMPKFSNIDILCNDETSENWVIADFNGDLNLSNNEIDQKLFKSISAFSSLHILNVKIGDFNESTGEPNDEISQVLSWYAQLKNEIYVAVIIRDKNKKLTDKLTETIKNALSKRYSNLELLAVENFFDPDKDLSMLHTLKNTFIKNFDQKILKNQNLKIQPMHSIFDIETFYNNLSNNDGNINFSFKKTESKVEQQFKDIFKFDRGNKVEILKTMFELSNICKKIELNELELNRLLCSHDSHDVDSKISVSQE